MTYGEYLWDKDQVNELYTTSLYSDANLISYWRMEWNSNDSKWSNNGTDANITYWSSYGKFWQWASFNGSNSYISIPDNDAFDFGSWNFTISYWINITDLSNSPSPLAKWIYNSNWRYITYTASLLQFICYSWWVKGTTFSHWVSLWKWEHYAYVRSWTNGKRYKNWVEQTLATDNTIWTITANSSNMIIWQFTNLASNKLNGSLDDIAIFSRDLSSTEITTLYKTGATKLLLHLNGNSTDSSWNWNNWTDTAITYSLANGKFWQGAWFNGTSSRISLGTAIAMPTDLTFSCWVKHTNTTSYQSYIWDWNSTGTSVWYFWQDSGKLKFYWWASAWNYRDYTTTNVVISTNISHVLVTKIWTNAPVFYVNGIQVSSSLFDSWWVVTKPTAQWTSIWRLWLYNWFYFNWAIDEVIIENVVRSPEKIKKYYTYTKGRFWIV